MGKKKWPRGGVSQNFPKPPSLFATDGFEFNNMPPPSNTLYPDVNPPPNVDFQSSNDGSGNLPPWQRNRGAFRSNQDQNIDSAPWNKDSRLESQLADRSAYGVRSADTQFEGRYHPDNDRFLRDQQLSNFNERRGGNPNLTGRWNDREMNDGRNEMNSASLHSNNNYQTFPGSNQDRFDASQPEEWSNRPSSSRDQLNRFGSSQKPDWTDELRHEEWRNKNYQQPPYNDELSKQGSHWEGGPREQDWINRQERSWRDEWKAEQQRHDERWVSSSQNQNWSDNRMRDNREPEWLDRRSNQDLNERNWNENLRNRSDPVWARESRQENAHWNSERDILISSRRSGEAPEAREQTLNTYGGPSDRRDYGRKRERSPVNPNVWSRLEPEPRLDDNFRDMVKKFKTAGEVMLNNQRSKDIKSLDLKSQGPAPLFGNMKPPGPPNYDLRSQLSGAKSLTPYKPPEANMFDIYICPGVKKSRFLPKDLAEIKEKLVKSLYLLADSSDLSKAPQLRFKNIKMESKSRIVVACQDAATAKWLLWCNLGKTRFPMRIILPEDPTQLAIIGLLVKGPCDFNSYEMKLNLRTQNPGLDVSKWVEGDAIRKKKGLSFIYQVDGHTLRYLVKNKWELFIGMNKIHVNRLKTNFNFNASSYPRL